MVHNDVTTCDQLFFRVGMRGLHALIFMLLRQYVLVPHQNLAFVSFKQTKPITIDGLRLRLLRLDVDLRAILVRLHLCLFMIGMLVLVPTVMSASNLTRIFEII